jgi:hypothetical protein
VFWVGRCYGCVVSCGFVFGVFVSMYFVHCFVVLVVVPGLFRELCFVFFVLLSRGCGFVRFFYGCLGRCCFVLVLSWL